MPLLDVDLADLDNFASGFPHDVFARHRREHPVFWHDATSHTPDGEGFWSVATHAETLAVLVDASTFSSETGGSRPYGGTVLNDLTTAGKALNMMDDPRHQRVRRLVSKGFTPRMIARLEDELRVRTRPLLDGVAERGECDFVVDVAAELPMQVISFLLGVPDEDRHQLFAWIEHTFDFQGTRNAYEQTDESMAAAIGMFEYGARLIARKRELPADDMLSVVVHAEFADESPSTLTPEELAMFFSLLFAAGAETTRNATAGGLLALITHPSELIRLTSNPALLPTTIEEAIRWTSPSAYNRRTATVDVSLAGQPVRAGDKVVFWEASANRDELVFGPSAARFDAGRDPNPHLGFGHGIHHCLGANLARLEMRVIYEEFLGRFDELALAGEPEWTRSNKHTGLRHLPVRFEPRRRERHDASEKR